MAIAPWLNPLDFIGAMHQGAALGLQQRQIGNQASEAAGNLAAKYAEMGNQAAMASDRVSADREQAAASLALRKSMDEQQGLERQAQLNQQAALAANALAERTQAANDLNAFRTGTLKENSRHHGAIELSAAQKLLGGNASIITHPETPGVLYLRNPSGSEVPIIRPAKGLTGESVVLDSDYRSQIRALEKKLATDGISETDKADWTAQKEKLLAQRKSLYGGPPVPADTSAADALKAASNFRFTYNPLGTANSPMPNVQAPVMSPAGALGSLPTGIPDFTEPGAPSPATQTNRIRVYNPDTGDFE